MAQDKLGALWVREKNGREYLSGEFEQNGEKTRVVAFSKSGDSDPIGSLYGRVRDNGEQYYTGTVSLDSGGVKVVAFKNGFKTEERHPDYILYRSTSNTADEGEPDFTIFKSRPKAQDALAF